MVVLTYLAHKALQAQYHKHCSADLFRVILMQESTMCAHITRVLTAVEFMSKQTVNHMSMVMMQLLNRLVERSAVGLGMLAP